MAENAWRIPVRTELILCGPWQDANITVRAAELQTEPDARPESPDAGEDPEPIDDLGLCCEAKLDVYTSLKSIDSYTKAVKTKAGFLRDVLLVEFDKYLKGKSVNLYAVRQLAKDMKQYADEAWRIADQLIKDKE